MVTSSTTVEAVNAVALLLATQCKEWPYMSVATVNAQVAAVFPELDDQEAVGENLRILGVTWDSGYLTPGS